jgi:hypothetical protein
MDVVIEFWRSKINRHGIQFIDLSFPMLEEICNRSIGKSSKGSSPGIFVGDRG